MNLSYNSLSIISKRSFDSFSNLIELDLSFNSLVSIQFLEPLKKLQFLNLSGNKIKSIIEEVRYPEILKLNLSKNILEKTSKIGLIFPNLTELDLSDNLINQFCEIDFIKSMNLLITLNLEGNPIFKVDTYQKIMDFNSDIELFEFFQEKLEISSDLKNNNDFSDLNDEMNKFLHDEEVLLQFQEATFIHKKSKVNSLKFDEMSEKTKIDFITFDESLNKKKWEAEAESRCSNQFISKNYKAKCIEDLMINEGLEQNTFSSLSDEKNDSELIKNNGSMNLSNEKDITNDFSQKEKNGAFRIKTLKKVLNFRKTQNLANLESQTLLLKKLFGKK